MKRRGIIGEGSLFGGSWGEGFRGGLGLDLGEGGVLGEIGRG